MRPVYLATGLVAVFTAALGYLSDQRDYGAIYARHYSPQATWSCAEVRGVIAAVPPNTTTEELPALREGFTWGVREDKYGNLACSGDDKPWPLAWWSAST